MEKKKEYERTKLELICFDTVDIITASGDSTEILGEGEGGALSWDNNGWT